MSPTLRSPKKSPPKNQQLRHPLLQRNRTQSQASLQGNTIDMVRIVRKNQQSRHSLINIDHRQYMKHNNLSTDPWRHSQSQIHKPATSDHQSQQQQQNLSSTFVHQDTQLQKHKNNPQFIQHYIRPSNVNLLNEMNQQGNNKVLGLTMFCLFLFLFSTQTLVCSYFLYACHVIFDHYEYILVLNYQYYDYIFEQIETQTFLPVLVLYLVIQLIYHSIIFFINMYTNGKYKLIDRQTSRISYILKCREFTRNSHSIAQKVMRSPRFTISLIIVSTILYSYSIVHCYYYSQLNYIYVYFMSSPIISLIQIFYFANILPDIWKYLFFQKMHITQHRPHQNESHEEQSSTQHWRIPPLTDFTLEHWWIKLALVVLLASFVYSLFVSFWLIIITFSKIQINFKKMKYKIDTFYLQAIGKLILLVTCLIVIYSHPTQQPYPSFLTLQYSIQCITFITISLLLTRILSNIFIRQQLYKYFYSQMNINIANLVFAFGIVYVINRYVGQVEFMSWSIIFVGLMAFGLVVSLYSEENHRLLIKFNYEDRQSEQFVEMGNF